MKLIKPSEISGKIQSMIEESNERVVLVSPYMKISKWYRLKDRISDLKRRNIPLEIYVRDGDNEATYQDLDEMNLRYIKVPHLHSKIYLNENYGIVSSMNLLLSSELKAVEIGYHTETEEEYQVLLEYYRTYIRREPFFRQGQSNKINPEFAEKLRDDLEKRALPTWIWLMNKTLLVKTSGNNYKVTVYEGFLKITTQIRIRSKSDLTTMQDRAKKAGDLTHMDIEIKPGIQPGRMELHGKAWEKSGHSTIGDIMQNEYSLEEILHNFIKAIEAT